MLKRGSFINLFFQRMCHFQLQGKIKSVLIRHSESSHDDVIKWKHFPRYWPFVRGLHGGPVKSPHQGQWRGPMMFSLICVWINVWVNNREAGDLRRYRAHYDVIVMQIQGSSGLQRYKHMYTAPLSSNLLPSTWKKSKCKVRKRIRNIYSSPHKISTS